ALPSRTAFQKLAWEALGKQASIKQGAGDAECGARRSRRRRLTHRRPPLWQHLLITIAPAATRRANTRAFDCVVGNRNRGSGAVVRGGGAAGQYARCR